MYEVSSSHVCKESSTNHNTITVYFQPVLVLIKCFVVKTKTLKNIVSNAVTFILFSVAKYFYLLTNVAYIKKKSLKY